MAVHPVIHRKRSPDLTDPDSFALMRYLFNNKGAAGDHPAAPLLYVAYYTHLGFDVKHFFVYNNTFSSANDLCATYTIPHTA